MVHLTIFYNSVLYEVQSEFILYSSLKIKDLLAQNKRHIWGLSDSNGIRTHNHLLCKWTLKNLAKLAK